MNVLEDVFKTSGLPTFTFVQPPEYTKLIVALRTKGRSLIVEGPSGIGKTTCVQKAIDELGLRPKVTLLSARKKADVEMIKLIPDIVGIGLVIVDDFHVLDESTKKDIADYIKTLADEENPDSKVIAIGINKAGDSLIKFAPDLNNRIDTIRFESNPNERILELIAKGQVALNVVFKSPDAICEIATGSFHITQMICKECCVVQGIIEEQTQTTDITVSLNVVRDKILDELERVFFPVARDFAVGSKLRPEGRAPYFHLLHWLSQSNDWSINLYDVVIQHQRFRGSINQVIDKGFLRALIDGNEHIKNVIHFDKDSRMLSIEDPKFLFYIHNILWAKFGERLGFINLDLMSNYDFALSFAGERRDVAEGIFNKLQENELEVFYDINEQERILAANVEDYLAPIYRSEASFVIALLSKEYPKKIWTQFESKAFRERFGENAVIPIWFSDVEQTAFDESRKYGGISFDVLKDRNTQIDSIADLLVAKIREFRLKSGRA